MSSKPTPYSSSSSVPRIERSKPTAENLNFGVTRALINRYKEHRYESYLAKEQKKLEEEERKAAAASASKYKAQDEEQKKKESADKKTSLSVSEKMLGFGGLEKGKKKDGQSWRISKKVTGKAPREIASLFEGAAGAS